jgi:hypothetical protein
MLLAIEFGLALLAVVVALTSPGFGSAGFKSLEHYFTRVARRRGLAVAMVGVSAVFGRLALLSVIPVPQPVYHDDFCYLLAADTFSHGRLTNPTHPMWVHFETFGVIHQPSYQCIAQPIQGFILAFGNVVLGNPFWGVLVSVGIMSAIICWMLQAWMPARWALLGGLIVILRLAIFGYWANSYWGGTGGAIGGALVLGALPRIKRSLRIRDVLLMSLGLAILANSRPYEGLVLSLPVAIALFAWILGREKPPLLTSITQVVVPIACCMILMLSAMVYYNLRVTGSPFHMAYQVEEKAYGVSPYFAWESPRRAPTYRHDLMRDMYVNRQLRLYHLSRSLPGVLIKALKIWKFYLGPVLTLPLVLGLFTLRSGLQWNELSRRARFFILLCGISLVGLSAEVFFEAHYAAPFTCVILAVVLFSMRQLRSWRIGNKPTGLFLVRAVPIICLVMFALRAVADPLHLWLPGSTDPAWFEALPSGKGRADILAHLQRLPGRHLVIVHYKPDRIPFEDWVYNEADIDNAKVVWAREMSPAENEELIKYFSDRRVWLVGADERPPSLSLLRSGLAPQE